MIADWFHTMVDRKGFAVHVYHVADDEIEVASDDTRTMISLLLQRQRQKSGLSLAQVSERLGASSRNAYARYERGVTVPTVEKLDELLKAVAPNRDIVVRESLARS
jgi:ribosome-binding protein aMBF1 (putative translation factor)